MNRLTVVLLCAFFPVQVLLGQEVGTLSGIVTDKATGAALAGAQVVVVGTRLSAATARDGRFSIEAVPVGTATVRVRLIGFGSAEQTVAVAAAEPASVDFVLSPQAVELEGVVVVGYGTQQRGDITGAVGSVSADQFVQAPARDAASLIAGKVAGLAVTTPSGDPRSGTEISLRGAITLSGNRSPLVIVDGIPGSLNTVAPQDVEDISVLKDGSAGAIYGSRASNGVIFVTTKRYAGGAPTIRYESFASQQTLYRSPDFLTAADYRRWNAYWQSIGQATRFEDLGYSTDWQSQVLRQPASATQNVTITGGAVNTNYTGSLSYENRQGIFRRSDDRQVTARMHVTHAMYDGRLNADVNVVTRFDDSFFGPDFNYAWRQTLIRNPTDRVKDDQGTWQERGTYFYTNPVGLINEDNGDEDGRDTRLHGTLTFRPTANLRLSVLGGSEWGSLLQGNATTFRHANTTQNGMDGTAYRYAGSNVSRIMELTGTLAEQVGRHEVTLLGGYSYQDFGNEYLWFRTYDFPTDLFGYNLLESSYALADGKSTVGSNKSSYKVIGFFGRLNYTWDNRFLLMGSLRYDGDSRFGAGHKWGAFPAISAGWRVSQEGFIKSKPFISDLKLRAGYGVTGSAPNLAYQSLLSYRYGGKFLYNGEWVQGLSPSRNPNPNLAWERKDEINVGLDFSLFDFRLAGSVDVYRRDTKGLLYNYSVPVPPNLFGSILANVGRMRNNGIEAQLTYDVVRRPELRWTSSANWSTNSNRLVSLSNSVYVTSDSFYTGYTGEPIQQSTHMIKVGEPIGNFYGYKAVDIDSTGEWIVLDRNGNRIPIDDVTEGDRRVLGNGLPKHYLAWNNAFRWKKLDVSVNMRGAFGFQILNFQRMFYENPTILQYNMLKSAFDKVYGKRTLNYDLAYVSYYIEDGDYWKVDNVTVGYSLGAVRLLSTAVANARLYVTGRNLLTLTGYKGLDPEVSTRGPDGLSPGDDVRDKYPTTRVFSAGISLTF
jgi:TonB-linked SusC/RagA family outer membrane protein